MSVTERDALFYSPEVSPSMIFHHLEKFHFSSLFDPLSSTSGGSGYFKLQNVRVISNDPAMYAYVRGKGLWENNNSYIPDETIERVCAVGDGDLDGLVRFSGFAHPHLTDEMKAFLDLWHIRIHRERDENIQALMCTAVLWCIDYWITIYEHGAEPSFDPPSLLEYYLRYANRQVMNNHESNEMWRENPHLLVSKVLVDAMFLNPPPLKGYASYGLRERIAEAWLRGDVGFDPAGIAEDGTLGSAFADVDRYMSALADFLGRAGHIQLWIITLSNRQPFTYTELEGIVGVRGRKMAAVDIELMEGFFSSRAVHTVAVAGG
jgi:hypothetical protein